MAKNCDTCKHKKRDIRFEEPCNTCNMDCSNWESIKVSRIVPFSEVLKNPRKRYKHCSWYSEEYYTLKYLLEILSRYNETDIMAYITLTPTSYWILQQ